MPRLTLDGHALNAVLDGPEDAPVIVFSNSLGATVRMWEPQVRALSGRYRCLRYDARGHGESDTVDAAATIDDFANDLAGLLDVLAIERAHVVGLSLGGMTAQAFASTRPERVGRLVLMATAARLGPVSAWDERAATARRRGTAALADTILARWFTADFADAATLAAIREGIAATDPAGYARACEAIRDMDLRERLPAVTAPTLILAGAEDPSTPPSIHEPLRDAIPGSELIVVEGAAHLLNLERAEFVNRHLASFLDAG